MSTRRSRHHEEEEHENHERWLVTYADMVTLLTVLFIVMFAMSQVDERKFMALKNGLAAGFANSKSVLPGSQSLLEESGTQPIAPIAPDHRVENLTSKTTGSLDSPSDAADAQHRMQAQQEAKGLRKLQAKLLRALAKKGLADDVRTAIDDRGLVVSLVSQHVVFRADEAELSPRGERVVDALGPVLQAIPQDLEISGHTNQVKVKPKNYATDWDLSAARAVTVLRRLNEQLGVPADRLSAAAYGHTKPLVDPSLPGSQAVNKRVDIVVLSASDEQTRELVAQLANEDPAGLPVGVTATGTAAKTTTGTATGTPTLAQTGPQGQEGPTS
jgi:chemotaxis protein MotB